MTESTFPAWHTDAFPEFRSTPPWVMEEMIASEPELPAMMAGCQEMASAMASSIQTAARRGDPVVVTGCGTSEHGAMAVGILLDRALRAVGVPGGSVEVRQALEAALDPRAGGICLAVSHEGGTRATNLALEAARTAGASTAAITARGDSAIVEFSDQVMVTPVLDRSWCHTVAYMSAILAGALIAAGIEETTSEADPLGSYLSRVMGLRGYIDEMADGLSGARQILVCGSGGDRVTARELALKIEEGVRIPAVAYDLETLLHGHLAAADSEDGLVLFDTDPMAGARLHRRVLLAMTACRRIGMRTGVVLSAPAARSFPPEAASLGSIVLAPTEGVSPLVAALTGSALVLQLLTLALVQRASVNPDLIRREEESYREAAALAEGDGAW